MIAMSPLTDSLISRTKKSILGLPIPILTIEIGVPLYRPVMVKNPRSDESTKGAGFSSKNEAIVFALEGVPTVTYMVISVNPTRPCIAS